jgi:formylglycine-generating enzyme required for sulfatase activity
MVTRPLHAESRAMEWIPGGRFTMGSNHHWPEEKQGQFPYANTLDDGWLRTSPVGI